MFPTSVEGRVPMQERASVDTVLSRIEQALRAERATDITRIDNKISFRAGLFRFVMNWNVLAPVGKGEIEVVAGNPNTVRYKFSCVEMLVVATAMVAVLSLIARSFTVFLIMWLWLFGMNYLVAAIRLPRFVRRATGTQLAVSVQASNGTPVRWSFILVFVLVWNVLFVIDGIPSISEPKAPGPLAVVALGILFVTSTLTRRSPLLQSWVMKPGRSVGEIQPFLSVAQVVSGLMLVGFALFWAVEWRFG